MANGWPARRTEKIEEEELPVVIENGELSDVGDDKEIDYAQRNQERLREAILNQKLPMQENFDAVVDALKESFKHTGMFILQGETGSGKSIFTPLAVKAALKELGLIDQTVVMQPRRDAARGVARAVSAVANEKLGEGVGFSTSEHKEQQWYTPIKVVTPGIFIKYLANGSLTKDRVGCLIIDEAHESTVDRDLVLGLIKLMRDKGDAPKIVLTSATLDKKKLQDYFGLDDQDYLNVEGRRYPVEKTFLTNEEKVVNEPDYNGITREREKNYLELAADKVKQIHETQPPGDVLVFLPGSFEINNLIDRLQFLTDIEVLPLHGGLKPEERDLALLGYQEGSAKRRVIVSTNIAETSVTVPGIKYVVDSCRQRMVQFDPKKGAVEKGTEFISKDQAEQRAGRAGRISEGNYYSLLTEDEYQELDQHPKSEIRKVNFSHTYLRIKSFSLEVEDFPFIDPPSLDMIKHANEELKILGALDKENNLTAIGNEMMDLSMYFEPRIARMIIEAKKFNCVPQALLMAAFERESSVFLPPSKDDDEKYGSRKMANMHYQALRKMVFRSNSDFIRSLQVFSEALKHCLLESKHWDKSPEGLAKYEEYNDWCDEYRINPKSLKHIAFNMKRYLSFVGQSDFNLNDLDKNIEENNLSKVILSSYPDRLMYLMGRNDYVNPKSISSDYTSISPGSAAFGFNNPRVCLGKIEEGRGRSYLQNVHPLELATLYEIAPDLVSAQKDGEVEFIEENGQYFALQPMLISLNVYSYVNDRIKVKDPKYTDAQIREIIKKKQDEERDYYAAYEREALARRERERINETIYTRREAARKEQEIQTIRDKFEYLNDQLNDISAGDKHYLLVIFPDYYQIEKVLDSGESIFRANETINSMTRYIEYLPQLKEKYQSRFQEVYDLLLEVKEYVDFALAKNGRNSDIDYSWRQVVAELKGFSYFGDQAEALKTVRRQLNAVKKQFRSFLEQNVNLPSGRHEALSEWENKAVNYLAKFDREEAEIQAAIEAKKAAALAEKQKRELTPEQRAEILRKKLIADLANAEFLFRDVISSNKTVKDPQTKLEKEIKRLVDRAKEQLAKVKESQAQSQDQKKDISLSGVAVNLFSTAERISSEIERLNGQNPKWFDVYQEIMESIIPELETEWGIGEADVAKAKQRIIKLAKDRATRSEDLKDKILEILTNP